MEAELKERTHEMLKLREESRVLPPTHAASTPGQYAVGRLNFWRTESFEFKECTSKLGKTLHLPFATTSRIMKFSA